MNTANLSFQEDKSLKKALVRFSTIEVWFTRWGSKLDIRIMILG